jgi:hypothetical protein
MQTGLISRQGDAAEKAVPGRTFVSAGPGLIFELAIFASRVGACLCCFSAGQSIYGVIVKTSWPSAIDSLNLSS